jgi:hypothetical protein
MCSSKQPAPKPERRLGEPTACERCGAAMQLLNVLAPLGPRPGYRIFGCSACTAIEWVEVDDRTRRGKP